MRTLVLILIAVSIATLTGCNHEGTSPQPGGGQVISVPAQQVLDQNKPGEDDISTTVSRAMLSNPPIDAADTSYDVYVIVMIWGTIPRVAANAVSVHDWSGKAEVNAVGSYQVMFPIDFERGQDSLIPVNSPTTIAWVSKTNGDFDGLATMLFLKRGVEYFAEPRFVYSTDMASVDVPVSKLDKLDTMLQTNIGQSLVIWSRRIVIPKCPAGTLSGDWVRVVNTGDSGYFHGIWYGSDGQPIGPLVGTFWKNADGSRQFAGGWSQGMLTVIAGEIRGTWFFDDPTMCPMCGTGHGQFHGKFVEKLGDKRTGEVHGVFGNGFGAGATSMPFKGVWKVVCDSSHMALSETQ
jgi:hypothetical protein